MPMIAKSAIEIPWNWKPFFGSLPVVNQEMVFIEGIPILHQRGGGKIIQIGSNLHALVEKFREIGCSSQIAAKTVQLPQPFGLPGFLFVMAGIVLFRTQVAQVSHIRTRIRLDDGCPFELITF